MSGDFSGKGKNILIEIYEDINLGDEQISFHPGKGSTITIDGDPDGDGTNAKITGTDSNNPTIRVYGDGTGITPDKIGGTVTFRNLDYEKTKNSLIQYYNYPTINIDDCYWTAIGTSGADRGSILLSTSGGIVNINSGSVVECKSVAINDIGSTATAKNIINVNEGAKIIANQLTGAAIKMTLAEQSKVVVNGGVVDGNITVTKGELKLDRGVLHGGLVGCTDSLVTKNDDLFIINDPVVAKIYAGSSATVYKEIKMSAVGASFVEGDNNIICADQTLKASDVRIELVKDINVKIGRLCFYAASGKTVTINGNGYKIYSILNAGNSIIHAHDEGTITFNNVGLYHRDGSCFQYYGGPTININNCEWVTKTHTGIWATSTGSANKNAILNINSGTSILAGSVALYIDSIPDAEIAEKTNSNTINIASGATLGTLGASASDAVVRVSARNKNLTMTVAGNISSPNGTTTAIDIVDGVTDSVITVNGGSINGMIKNEAGTTSLLMNSGTIGTSQSRADIEAIADIKAEFTVQTAATITDPDIVEETTAEIEVPAKPTVPEVTTTEAPDNSEEEPDVTTQDADDETGSSFEPDGTTQEPTQESTQEPTGTGEITTLVPDGTEQTPIDNTTAQTEAPEPDESGEEQTTGLELPQLGGCAGCGPTLPELPDKNAETTAALFIGIVFAAALAVIIKKK